MTDRYSAIEGGIKESGEGFPWELPKYLSQGNSVLVPIYRST